MSSKKPNGKDCRAVRREASVASSPPCEARGGTKLDRLVGELNGRTIVPGLERPLSLRERGPRHVNVEAPSFGFLYRSGRLPDPDTSRFRVCRLRGTPCGGCAGRDSRLRRTGFE